MGSALVIMPFLSFGASGLQPSTGTNEIVWKQLSIVSEATGQRAPTFLLSHYKQVTNLSVPQFLQRVIRRIK